MNPSDRNRTIEIALFGFLVSLTLKGSLDTAYSHSVSQATSATDLFWAVWVPSSFLLFVFLVTLMRFVYGAYRFHEESHNAESNELGSWSLLWNIFATLVLFVMFYLAGLSIRHAKPFFICLIAAHLWDLIWFATTLIAPNSMADSLKAVMRKFILLDLVTVLLLAILILAFRYHYRTKAAILLLLLSIADLYLNRSFFFHPEEWRALDPSTGENKV